MWAARNGFLTRPSSSGVVFKGANRTYNTSSVTIPEHSVGDIILVATYRNLISAPANPPSAGGTVPTWTSIGSPTSGFRVSYAVATATNHTSGTWSTSNELYAVVLSGQRSPSPIGSFSYTGSGEYDLPNINPLTKSDGTSQIVSFSTNYVGGSTATWTSAPTGGTARLETANANEAGGWLSRCITKDVTTTSAGGTTGTNDVGGAGFRVSVEIVAP